MAKAVSKRAIRRRTKPVLKRPKAKSSAPKLRTKSKPRARSMGNVSAMLLSDARKITHIPPPMAAGPYSVVHSRSLTTITTSTTGQSTVLLATSFCDTAGIAAGNNVLPFHAIYGVGTNVPGTTESYIADPVLSGSAAATYQLALHALTVTVTCADSALGASGLIYMGTLPVRLARSNFATWNAVAANVSPRAEMRSMTAFATLQNSEMAVRHASVMDSVTWQDFCPSAANTSGSTIAMRDSLSNIVVVFTPTTAAVNYVVTIHAEWRIMYNVDQQLAATQKLYTPSNPAVLAASRALLVSSGGMTPGAASRDSFLGASWQSGPLSPDNPRVLFG